MLTRSSSLRSRMCSSGTASDGGLFISEDIPFIPSILGRDWLDLSFKELAFASFRSVDPSETSPEDLRRTVYKCYENVRCPDVTTLATVDQDKRLHLLELFHGPTFAFRDVALQFLGNLLEYFLVRRNEYKPTLSASISLSSEPPAAPPVAQPSMASGANAISSSGSCFLRAKSAPSKKPK